MIHYIGYYIAEENEENDTEYSGNAPGKLKMRYVAQKLSEAGRSVRILSFADKNDSMIYLPRNEKIREYCITYIGGVSCRTKIGRKINLELKKL